MMYLISIILLFVGIGDVNVNNVNSNATKVSTAQIKPCGSFVSNNTKNIDDNILGCPDTPDWCAVTWVEGSGFLIPSVDLGDPITIIAPKL